MSAQNVAFKRPSVYDFLTDLFGNDWPEVWVASVPGDPSSRDNVSCWRGGRAGDMARHFDDTTNLYYSVSVVKGGSRKASAFVMAPIVVLDDVGSKVDAASAIAALGQPRWAIETSNSNEQWVYRLDTPIEDPRVYARIMRAMALKGWTDPGAIDVTHAMRLPAGINGKPKYGSPSPIVRALTGPDESGDDLDFVDLCRALDLDPIETLDVENEPVAAGPKDGGKADMARPDLILKALMDMGRVIGPGREPGVVDIECPFSNDHTAREDSGTAYFGGGAFKCHHGHCQNRSNWDFKAKVQALYDEKNGTGAFVAIAFDAEPDAAEIDRLASTVRSATAKAHSGSRRGAKDAALALLNQMGAQFVQERDGRPFLRLGGATLDISVTAHQRAVLGIIAAGGVGSMSKTARGEFIDEITSRALVGPVVTAQVRVAATPGRIVLDMADDKRRRIVITAGGWSVEDGTSVPEFMTSYPGSLPLPDPAIDGRPGDLIERLRAHVNLAPMLDPRDPMDAGRQAEAALLLFLAGMINPVGGVPGAMISGPNGAGKTAAARRLAGLIDPHAAQTVGAPSDPAGFFIVARSRLVTVVDNVSSIPGPISDLACSLATGGGLALRTLYTTGEVSNLIAKRPLIWTSIVEAIKRADLLDRTANITLAPLTARRTDAELDADWSRDHPAILALLLDVAAKALASIGAVRQTIAAADLPRMADAAVFAEAMARVLGWRPGLLIETLNGARAQAAGDLLSADPIAARIDKLLAKEGGCWEGTANELLGRLSDFFSPSWRGGKAPAANQLSAALARMAQPAHEARGWVIRVGAKRRNNRNRDRLIEITGAASTRASDVEDADL